MKKNTLLWTNLAVMGSSLLVVLLAMGLVLESVIDLADPDPVPDEFFRACVDATAQWEQGALGGTSWRFYGPGGSRLGATPVEEGLSFDLRPGESLKFGHPARTVARSRNGGACEFVVLENNDMVLVHDRFVWWVLPLGILSVLFTLGMTTRFLLRPLRMRIDALRLSARSTGSADFASARTHDGDAMDEIAGALDDLHHRIEGERTAATRRHIVLERHLSTVAHDLRTPLASAGLALEQAALHVENRSEAVHRARLDLEYMHQLVENLHQATRLEYEIDICDGECDLSDLVQRLELRFRPIGRLHERVVSVAYPDQAAVVRGDPTIIERAVSNLVHNAIAHGGPHVAVVLELCDRGGFRLNVANDGPVLPMNVVRTLPTLDFQISDERPRERSLGLAIANTVCRRLEWSISYSSPDAGGLSVVVEGVLVDGAS